MSTAALEVEALTSYSRQDIRYASQDVIVVYFEGPDGQRWSAIGGGVKLADALTFARDSCPVGTAWRMVSWEQLYGD